MVLRLSVKLSMSLSIFAVAVTAAELLVPENFSRCYQISRYSYQHLFGQIPNIFSVVANDIPNEPGVEEPLDHLSPKQNLCSLSIHFTSFSSSFSLFLLDF